MVEAISLRIRIISLKTSALFPKNSLSTLVTFLTSSGHNQQGEQAALTVMKKEKSKYEVIPLKSDCQLKNVFILYDL